MRVVVAFFSYVFFILLITIFRSLRLISPVIREHGIDYERGKFQDKLNDGSLTLQRTEVIGRAGCCIWFFILLFLSNRTHSSHPTPPQKWIRKTLSQKPASMVADLVAGKADAFVSLHTACMLSLVTDSAPVKLEETPETLLFDVCRLSLIQLEYNRLVDSSLALTMANHAIIGSDKAPSNEKRQVISDLNKFLAAGNRFDATEFCTSLDSAGVLTDAAVRAKFLKTVALSTENKADPVRQLM